MNKRIGNVRFLESLSVRLSLSLAGVVFVAMILMASLLAYLTFERELALQKKSFQSTAKIFATAVSTDFNEKNKTAVRRILTGIGRFDNIRFAVISNIDGTIFTELGYDAILNRNNVLLSQESNQNLLFIKHLWVHEEIRKSGVVIGHLRLLADISEIRKNVLRDLFFTAIISILAAFLIIVLALHSIRVITKPISRLSDLMIDFGRQGSYYKRVEEKGRGEIFVLARSFNAMLNDIEERNRQLLDYQQTLEHKVDERTKDLSTAKNEAEMANAAKSEFLATMSHEIRTPMNGMLVMTELLASSNLSSKHQRYADIVMKSGKSLLNIINDVLDFSKIESGKLDLETVDVALQPLIDDTMSLFWQQASQKGLDIAALIEDDVPATIKGDPVRLNQVLGNLVNNALKFTQHGTINLHVSMVTQGSQSLIRFSVKDTGVGIHQDKLAHVFESFTQADQSTTRKYGGTGLGLPICKKLIEAMGGEIYVESEPGYGADFIFTLPATAVNFDTSLSDRKNKRALLAIPVSSTFHVLKNALERYGIEVVALNNTEGISSEDYDYVFSFSENLHDFAKKEDKSFKIILTSIGDFTFEEYIKEGKAHDILHMPLSTYNAVDLVERLLRNQPLGLSCLGEKADKENALPFYHDKNILVADDNPVNREVIVQALRRFNITPDVVENGLEAISLCKKKSFDLIFMDCSMPEMDGFQATRLLREDEKRLKKQPIPIIALTAHMADHISEQWQESGMNNVIVKPFTMSILQKTLAHWFNNNKKQTENSAQPNVSAQNQTENVSSFDDEAITNLKDLLGDVFETSFPRLLSLYEDTSPNILRNIERAQALDNFKQIAEEAHALKSMSGNIAAKKQAELCENLEKSGNEQNKTTCDLLIKDLFLSHKRLMEDIMEYRNNLEFNQ